MRVWRCRLRPHPPAPLSIGPVPPVRRSNRDGDDRGLKRKASSPAFICSLLLYDRPVAAVAAAAARAAATVGKPGSGDSATTLCNPATLDISCTGAERSTGLGRTHEEARWPLPDTLYVRAFCFGGSTPSSDWTVRNPMPAMTAFSQNNFIRPIEHSRAFRGRGFPLRTRASPTPTRRCYYCRCCCHYFSFWRMVGSWTVEDAAEGRALMRPQRHLD